MRDMTINANDRMYSMCTLPNCVVTAMAYVPFQTDKSMFDDATALCKGTLFINLNKPFCRGGTR